MGVLAFFAGLLLTVMCGIIGIVVAPGQQPPDAAVGQAMNDAIRHRGPDDEGYYRDARALLGMLTLSSLLSALSNARERFVLPGLDGVVNNTAIILVALLLARGLGVRALIVGITLGFFMQMCILCFGNRDLFRSSLRPAFALGHPDFLRPLAHLLPLLVGSVGAMLTGLVDQYFVSRLDAGSISALTYATMMAMLPVEVFAQAIITSYYPALGRGVAAGDHAAVTATWRSGQRLILLLTLPCAVLLVGLAKPIVVVLLEHGRFDDRSTALTVEAMSILAIGMKLPASAHWSTKPR